LAAISFDQKMIRRRQSQQHHCSVCAGLSAQRERVWWSRTPSLTGLLLSPRQRRWASAGFGWWRRAVAPALRRVVAPTLL